MNDSVSQLRCKTCDKPKSRDEFYDEGRQNHLPPEQRRKQRACKSCQNKSSAQRQRDNKERVNELKRLRRKTNPEKWRQEARKDALKKCYGITIFEYEAMLEAQHGVCAICKQPEIVIHNLTGQVKRLAVDHCHKTGQVRGLLCQQCNHLLARCTDNINILYAAADYLQKC